jgi:hypothetical protein
MNQENIIKLKTKTGEEAIVNMGTPFYLLLSFLFISSFVSAPIIWAIMLIIAYFRKEILFFINFFILINIVYIIYPIIYNTISPTLGYIVSIILFAIIIVSFTNRLGDWHLTYYLKKGYVAKDKQNNNQEIDKKTKIPFYIFIR